MAIDVNLANSQANQLRAYSNRLAGTKTQLVSYRNSVSAGWQGQEVNYIASAIDQIIKEIDSTISTLNALGNEVSSTANTIRQEEEAAAARAREEERRRREAEEQKRREEEARQQEEQRKKEEAEKQKILEVQKTIASIFSRRYW